MYPVHTYHPLDDILWVDAGMAIRKRQRIRLASLTLGGNETGHCRPLPASTWIHHPSRSRRRRRFRQVVGLDCQRPRICPHSVSSLDPCIGSSGGLYPRSQTRLSPRLQCIRWRIREALILHASTPPRDVMRRAASHRVMLRLTLPIFVPFFFSLLLPYSYVHYCTYVPNVPLFATAAAAVVGRATVTSCWLGPSSHIQCADAASSTWATVISERRKKKLW